MAKCEHDEGIEGYISHEMKECPYCRIAELEVAASAVFDAWYAYTARPKHDDFGEFGKLDDAIMAMGELLPND